jgi:hypothetical protein
MRTVIDIFTIIGSIIGILAFIRIDLNSKRQHNKDNWNILSEILDLESLIELSEMASFGVIPKMSSSKLRLFVDKINNKHPITKFKGKTGKIIESKLAKINLLYDKYHTEVQVPIWQPFSKNEDIRFKIDKKEIDKLILEGKTFSDNFDEVYNQSIDNAYLPLVEMIEAYRDISYLVNKLPFEKVTKRKLVEFRT